MNHLLILLSILLLSSPLFGQSKETGVLYQFKTSSGFVWKTFGKGEVQPKYKGEISNGTPEGLGVLSYPFTDGKPFPFSLNILPDWIPLSSLTLALPSIVGISA